MKVLLTGADGVLGNNLVRELLSRNYKVSVMLLNEQLPTLGLNGLAVQRYFGNILDRSAVANAISGHDMVIHAAASTQVYPARNSIIHEVNVTGTSHVIEACLKHKVKRLIHIGTANSFAPGCKQKPGNENGRYNGFKYGLDYIDSKHEAQNLVLNAVTTKGLNAVIVNPTFMIGPYDTKPSSGALILALFHKKIPVYTHGSKTYVAVKDAAVAIVNSITLGQVGECYILGNHNLSYKEAFELIAETIGVSAPKFSLPSQIIKLYGIYNSWYAKISGRVPSVTKELAVLSCEHHCYSGEKARQQLHMPSTDMSIAVKECFEWFKQNGYTTLN
jgi:dihydroflavonol-4-reductase